MPTISRNHSSGGESYHGKPLRGRSLDSVDTVEEAVKLINEVKQIHSYAGFEIRNFCSNSAAVLGSIGEPGAPAEVSLNLENNLGTECVLGLVWRPTEDVFTFDLSYMKEEIKKLIADSAAPTKRQVLRTVMSLFDPLGLISHFVVHGKILMQQIWRCGTDWDEPIAGELLPKWRYWCLYMQRLGEVTVPRCFFKGMNSYALEDVEAHLFVDASEAACAAVLYLRCIQNSVPKCALIAGKTKVAPLKPISVPRLELQAAMIGTRMMDSVLRSLDIHVSRRYLWSDYSTVLCWLRSDSRRYYQFVAVRVGEILTLTSADEWHYVPSKINIADAATKWKEGPSFDPNDSWFTAPEFLRKSRDEWPMEPAQNGSETETELRSVFLYHGTVPQLLLDFNRFSNWLRLVRTAAYVLRAVRRFRGEKFLRPKVLTKEELLEAENMIWRQVQNEAYPDEYAILQRSLTQVSNPVSIPKSSPLYRLSAFVDEFCVVRMNSRLSAEQTLSYGLRHPILLPRLHPAVHLLAEYYHRRYLHGNAETICNEMRQKFFIPGLRILIRQVSKQCLTCRIKKSVPQPPMMAPLPQARTQTMVRPFTHTGVDYFGPIMVKQGRSLKVA
ncbi:uncharacterized protein LOC134207494 [Armigeres subalbatus]|uniref:uncharacterized protein LOC134207494 n=1 Tax=Armigeres subalbatus TaxID=124917 RepID=UPI002ED328E1